MKNSQHQQQNIPEGWKNKKLGEVLKIGSGKDYKHLGIGDIPVFGTGGYMSSVDKELYDGETVFIGRKGTIDKPFYFQGKFWTVDTLFYTYGFSGTSAKYVNYVFQKINWLVHNEASGVPSLSKSTIEKINFTFPPAIEQSHIVSILNTWDQAIQKLKRKIETKKEIKKGLMQKLLTGEIRLAGFTGNWSIHNLGELGKIISGGTPETINPNYWGNDYIWITPTEITKLKSRYILDSDKRISTLGLKNSSATLVPPQSLILCSRATIAECAINTVEVTTNQGFKNFVPKKIDIHFFYYWVKLNKKAFLRISAGSTFLEFGKGDMEKLRVEIPDMKEQKAISEILTKADDEIERLKQKLLIFRDQKRYLLNNLVTGTIRTPETLSIPK